MFVNMDMVNAAGFDETFVDSWDTFLACVTKMTKAGQTYGVGHRHPDRRLRRVVPAPAGGRRLVPDARPEGTQRQPAGRRRGHPADGGPVQAEDRAAARAPTPTTLPRPRSPPARWRSTRPTWPRRRPCPSPVPFNWKLLPYPPGPVSQVNFNDLSFYMINAKSADQDLMWEVVKWWTNGAERRLLGRQLGHLPGPHRCAQLGLRHEQRAPAGRGVAAFQKYAVGLENFTQWADVESLAEAEIQNCYAGKEIGRRRRSPTWRRSSSRRSACELVARSARRRGGAAGVIGTAPVQLEAAPVRRMRLPAAEHRRLPTQGAPAPRADGLGLPGPDVRVLRRVPGRARLRDRVVEHPVGRHHRAAPQTSAWPTSAGCPGSSGRPSRSRTRSSSPCCRCR